MTWSYTYVRGYDIDRRGQPDIFISQRRALILGSVLQRDRTTDETISYWTLSRSLPDDPNGHIGTLGCLCKVYRLRVDVRAVPGELRGSP